MGMLKGEGKKKGIQSIFKAIVADNFLNPGREMYIHIHEAQRIPNSLNLKRATPNTLQLNCQNSKTRNFKSIKRKERSYIQGNSHRQDYLKISQQNPFRPDDNGMTYSTY